MKTIYSPPSPSRAIDPAELAKVIDHLAARIAADGNVDLLAPWAVSRLASELGLEGQHGVEHQVGALASTSRRPMTPG